MSNGDEPHGDIHSRLAELRQDTQEVAVSRPAASATATSSSSTRPQPSPAVPSPAVVVDSDGGTVKLLSHVPASNILLVPPIPILASIRFMADYAADTRTWERVYDEHVNSYEMQGGTCGGHDWIAWVPETPWNKDAALVAQHHEAVLSSFQLRGEIMQLGLERRLQREHQGMNLWQVPVLQRNLFSLLQKLPHDQVKAIHSAKSTFWAAAAFHDSILNMVVLGNKLFMEHPEMMERFIALSLGTVEHDEGGLVFLPFPALQFLAPRFGDYSRDRDPAQRASIAPNCEIDLHPCRRHVLVRSLRPLVAGEMLSARLKPGRLWPFNIHMMASHWTAGHPGRVMPYDLFDFAVTVLEKLFGELKKQAKARRDVTDSDVLVLHGVDLLLRLRHEFSSLNEAMMLRLKNTLRLYKVEDGPPPATHLQDAFAALLTALRAKLFQ
jgi:hypothetical protein